MRHSSILDTTCVILCTLSCSPFQDDFFILHVQDDFDSVLYTVLKTEFLTLLSEKYKAITQNQLRFTFNRTYDFPVFYNLLITDHTQVDGDYEEGGI